ncbi:MAG: efflux RND transporter periplasmic adaptor subunit [Proteobacteria bacterium]|nr:efflux RND transporter periplasmic adaptor subunit [Pseudomonadota bacterium]
MEKRLSKLSLGIVLLLLPFSVFYFAGCQTELHSAVAEKNEEPGEEIIPVEVASITIGDIAASHLGSTSLKAKYEAVIVAEKQGVLREVLVKEGQQVEKGQVLARLDSRQEKLQLSLEQNKLKDLKRQLVVNRKLLAKNVVTSETVKEIQLSYQSQKIVYELAKLSLEKGQIKAPISGVLVKKHVKPGNLVQVYQTVFEITSFKPLTATIHIPEHKLSLFRNNLVADVAVDAFKNKVFRGVVTEISPVVNSHSGTFSLKIRLDNELGKLKPGMFARIVIEYDKHINALLVPREAIRNESGSEYVYVLNGSKVAKKPVKKGFSQKGIVEVMGIDPNSRVIVNGFNNLKDGSTVKVIE